jgi:hypothetical protein
MADSVAEHFRGVPIITCHFPYLAGRRAEGDKKVIKSPRIKERITEFLPSSISLMPELLGTLTIHRYLT